jgi:hypothetical protein
LLLLRRYYTKEDISIPRDYTIARTSDDSSNTHMSNNLSNDWEIVTNKSKKTQKNTT